MAFKGSPCLTLCDEIHAWFNRNAKASSRRIFLFLCWKSEFKATKNISSKTIFLPIRKINQNRYNLSKTDKETWIQATSFNSVSLYIKTFPFPFSLCHQMKLKNHGELKPGSSPYRSSGVRHTMYLRINKHSYRANSCQSAEIFMLCGAHNSTYYSLLF